MARQAGAGGLAVLVPWVGAVAATAALGDGLESLGPLVAAFIIAASAAVSYRIAGVRPHLLGLLAAEAVVINSLVRSGLPGLLLATAFAIVPGQVGAWWGQREWGAARATPPPAPLLVVGAVAAAALLTLNVIRGTDPENTVWADFPVGANTEAARQLCGALPGVTSTEIVEPNSSPLVVEPEVPVLRFTISDAPRNVDALRECLVDQGSSGVLVSSP